MLRSSPPPWLLDRRRIFGDRLRAIREWRNLSQEGLGNAAGMSRDSVVRYETGLRPATLDAMHLLAAALDVPVVALLIDCELPADGGRIVLPTC